MYNNFEDRHCLLLLSFSNPRSGTNFVFLLLRFFPLGWSICFIRLFVTSVPSRPALLTSINMKFLTLLTIAAATCATAQNSRRSIPRRRRGRQIGGPSPGIVPISQVPAVEVRATETGHNNRKGNNKGCNGEAGNQPANNVNASSFTGQTLVLFEVGGVPGNECLTFRNNGQQILPSLK